MVLEIKIRKTNDCIHNPLIFRRSFQLAKNEKFYVTFVFKDIHTETLITRNFIRDVLNRWSMEIVRYKSIEIAEDFGLFMVYFQHLFDVFIQGDFKFSTFDNKWKRDDVINYICDIFRFKPFATHTTFFWDDTLYHAMATLSIDEVEGYRRSKIKRWDVLFYVSGLPNMSTAYDYNCNQLRRT